MILIDSTQFKAEMEFIERLPEQEERHHYAEALMAKVLSQLGYQDGVDVFERMDANDRWESHTETKECRRRYRHA